MAAAPAAQLAVAVEAFRTAAVLAAVHKSAAVVVAELAASAVWAGIQAVVDLVAVYRQAADLAILQEALRWDRLDRAVAAHWEINLREVAQVLERLDRAPGREDRGRALVNPEAARV